MTDSFLRTYGQRLLDQGYPIIPIKRGYKFPRGISDWQRIEANETRLNKWLANGFADGGVGIQTRHFPAADLDVRDADIIDQLVAWCEANIGPTVQRVGQAPKILLAYRTDKPFPKIASGKYVDFLGLEHKVEILGDGQQFVAFADHPDTGKPYEWVSKKTLADIPAADLPTITEDQARDLVAFFESIVPDDWELVENAPTSKLVDQSIPEAERVLAHAKPKVDVTTIQLRKALSYLDPDIRMNEWVRYGMGLFHQYDGDHEGFDLWDEWSSGGSKYNETEMAARWRSFEANLATTNPVTAATIIHAARQARAQKVEDSAPKSKAKFALIHAQDVLAKLGPINWQITGFLEQNTTGLLFGDPGSFKSFIALDMAFHVAAGRDWHGRPVKQGPVIYIAGEGHGGLARRFAAWERHHGVGLADLPFYVSQQAAQFYDTAAAKEVVEAVNEIADHSSTPALIVIDTLARNFGGGDENSNTDMGVFLNHVDGLLRAKFGATVMIVHHTGHSHKERARGATALKGGMDFEFRVEKAGDDISARVVCTKMKDAKEPDDVWFKGREVLVGDFEEDMTSLVFDQSEAPMREVKSELKGKQAALFATIEQEAPVDRNTLREIVLSEGTFDNSDQFKRALQELKKKELVSEFEGRVGVMDPFFAGQNPDKSDLSAGQTENVRQTNEKGVS